MKCNEYLCLVCENKYENVTSLKIRKMIDDQVDIMREKLKNREEFTKLSIDIRYNQIKEWILQFNHVVECTELIKNKKNAILDDEFWTGVKIWMNYLNEMKNHYKLKFINV